MKQLRRFLGILFLLLIGSVIAAPWFFEGKLKELIKQQANNNMNATLDFDDVSFSFLKGFPDAYLELTDISVINKAPFEGDTLFKSGQVAVKMSLGELFKGRDEVVAVKNLKIDDATLYVKVDEQENANYDIAIEDESNVKSETDLTKATDSGFSFDLESYEITNSNIIYDDFASKTHLVISEMQHSGFGDLSLDISELQTKTTANVSFELDSTKYLNNNTIELDAGFGVDLTKNQYTFLKNKAKVNQLPLVFDGFVKLNDDSQEVDINFRTPSSDFKNFLAVIPAKYSKNIENVHTRGNFSVNGQIKGMVNDDRVPGFDIKVIANNASFKYPELPKSVENVNIDLEIINSTGKTEDTFIDIRKLNFNLDGDRFSLLAQINDLMGNTKVDADVDGKINLGNIAKAYPMGKDFNLQGVLVADLSTKFDMKSVENKDYSKTQTKGSFNLLDFKYKSDELKEPIVIDVAAAEFNPTTVSLKYFSGKIGKSDFSASGAINNLLGFMFNDEQVEGKFNLSSNYFNLTDLMVEEEQVVDGETKNSSSGAEERIKIPSFLNCSINTKAETVVYDNLRLKNVSGLLKIKDEQATLENLKGNLFGGELSLNGDVSTKEILPTFNMQMGIDKFDIGDSFQALDLFKVLAPVASGLVGKINSEIKISGNLKDDLTPDLGTLAGDVLAELIAPKIDTDNAPALLALDNQFDFIDVDDVSLEDLKMVLTFDDGRVNVKPYNIKYEEFNIKIEGSHSFDTQMQYGVTIDVPSKYLGNEVNDLIAQIGDDELKNLTIPVKANITGYYASPKVTSDLSSSATNLSKRLIEIQQEKAKSKGKSLLEGLLGKKENDTTQAKSNTSGDVLGGILGESQKKNDSLNTSENGDDQVKEGVKNIIGGLLGANKKKDTVN